MIAPASVCRDLAEDVARNGEGVHHVIRVALRGAPDSVTARAVGLSIDPSKVMVRLGADRTHEYVTENADYRS